MGYNEKTCKLLFKACKVVADSIVSTTATIDEIEPESPILSSESEMLAKKQAKTSANCIIQCNELYKI